jgi:hypothetical protein
VAISLIVTGERRTKTTSGVPSTATTLLAALTPSMATSGRNGVHKTATMATQSRTKPVPLTMSEPLSDSTSSQANAIYWTAQHGAFLIYGDIYQRWLSIGDVKSSVGYPVTDETGSGNYGGRFNDFTNGMIYWHAGNSWVHVGGLPSSLTWTWNPINLGDVTGSNTITISSNGDANWVSNIHDNSVLEFGWSVGWVLVDADGTAVTLYQSGTVGPNLSGIFGGPTNDNNIDTTVSNSVISENWRAWVAWNYGTALGNSGVDIPIIGSIINELVQIAKKVAPVIVAIISVLK